MNYRLSSVCESPAEYESQPEQKSVELAGHQRDPSRLQLNLFDQQESESSPNEDAAETVLGGGEETSDSTSVGVVYVVRDTYRGLYKIGFSKCLDQRMKSLKAGSPVPLTLLFHVPGCRSFEKYIHQTFIQHNTHNEWFDLSTIAQSKISAEYFLELFKQFQQEQQEEIAQKELSEKRIQERQEKTAQRESSEKRIHHRNPGDPAQGWIEFHTVRRKRKNGDIWETKQAWLHWEEKGQKRSRYIPKAKYADVENSVYRVRSPIRETLRLLEK